MSTVVYRMCGCEVVERIEDLGMCVRLSATLIHNGKHVADFKTRRAAISYLAKEFVIPTCP